MDAASTVEVVGAEGSAVNTGGGGGGDMAASVTSIMENSKDAMAELFQDEAEVYDAIVHTESYLFIFRRQEDRMEEQTLLIQDMPSRFSRLLCLFLSKDSHGFHPHKYVSLLILCLQANAGYEIPARLRTLHNLVIQYASQGR